MGITYRGALCVGYTYDQILEIRGESTDDLQDWYEGQGFDSFSPYFDADVEDCIYGCLIEGSDDYSKKKITEDLDDRIDCRKQQMEREYGIVPETYIMAHGW